MKLKFSDISIRTKLLVALAVPLVALTSLIVHNTIDGLGVIQDLNNVKYDTLLLTKSTDALHELQEEGAVSQLYIERNSDGGSAAKLKEQREKTDHAAAIFRTAVDNIDVTMAGQGPAKFLADAKNKLDEVLKKRDEIAERRLTQSQVVALFNDALDTFIAAEHKIRHEHAEVDADVAALARNYVTMVETKTKAGEVRSAGIAGFSAGQFTPQAFQIFSERVVETGKLFTYLYEIATPATRDVWTKAHNSNEVSAANNAQNRVLQVGADAPLWTTLGDWFRMATSRGDALEAVEESFGALLVETTAKRLNDEYKFVALEVGGTILLVLGTIVLGYTVYMNLVASVNNLSETVGSIAKGNYESRASILGGDEMGTLAIAFNQMLDDRVQALAKTQKENEILNNSVVDLLKAVFVLSQRDLTTRCLVDESVIGTVADSINQLTIETAKVLGEVTNAANRVGRASEKVKSQASSVSLVAESELQSVNIMTADIGKTVEQVSAMAELASNTNKSAAEATASTNEALDRVSDTVKGMESIRENIAETEKRIKRLGERSQEISGIVNLINTISERTHVLALNASMQAAIAGEAGRGFAVVAEEVQRLAESSRNATSQIAALVNNIQIETNDTVVTVNKTISQVVSESELARKAGTQMEKTQRITAQLAEMVQKIAASAQAQADSALLLRQQVSQIGAGAMQTREQIAAQNEETKLLEATAQQLLHTISVFKLPQEIIDSANDTQSITGSLPQAA